MIVPRSAHIEAHKTVARIGPPAGHDIDDPGADAALRRIARSAHHLHGAATTAHAVQVRVIAVLIEERPREIDAVELIADLDARRTPDRDGVQASVDCRDDARGGHHQLVVVGRAALSKRLVDSRAHERRLIGRLRRLEGGCGRVTCDVHCSERSGGRDKLDDAHALRLVPKDGDAREDLREIPVLRDGDRVGVGRELQQGEKAVAIGEGMIVARTGDGADPRRNDRA